MDPKLFCDGAADAFKVCKGRQRSMKKALFWLGTWTASYFGSAVLGKWDSCLRKPRIYPTISSSAQRPRSISRRCSIFGYDRPGERIGNDARVQSGQASFFLLLQMQGTLIREREPLLLQTILNERGHIYRSKHEGWYSVSDEAFYPAAAVHPIVKPRTGQKIMVRRAL
jgi:hypothetical protein